MSLLRKWLRNDLVVRVPDELDTSEGDTPVATEFAKMTTALREEMEAEKWRRAKAFIEQQIEAHQRALDAGGLSFDEFHVRSVKREAYKQILEVAENVPTKP